MSTYPHALFRTYTTRIAGTACYFAALPGYPQNFSRDTLIAGIIARDWHLLDNQLRMSSLHQGKREDPITGEEPGKIHHQYPGVIVHAPYETTYNACDTTALYLIGLEMLLDLNETDAKTFMQYHSKHIQAALSYIRRRIIDATFWEFPPAGAKHFSLHTTYWKDSVVPKDRPSGEPAYPVAYTLVQFQTARALLAASRLLGRDDIAREADAIFKKTISVAITTQIFCFERDKEGQLEQPSSDELHALAYLPPDYAPLLPIAAIRKRAQALITPAGIACTPRRISHQLADRYHGYVVWIFEQALIHYGCEKFGLYDIAEVAQRCIPYIAAGQELLGVEPGIEPLGNDHQLWSVAAKVYFSDMPSLRTHQWL